MITTTPDSTPQQDPYRWVMLAGMWLIYFCFGLMVVSTAPLVKPIVEDLDLSLAAMGSLMGAWPLVYIAAAIPCGAFLDRFGLRRGLLIAAALMTVSGLLRAAAVDYSTMFIAIATFGIGGPLVSVGAPKLISAWFAPAERGLAMGIYITGPSLGGIIALTLTNSVLMPLAGGSWRACLLIYTGIIVLAGIAWFLISHHHASRAQEAVSRSGGSLREQVRVFGELLARPAVRVMLLLGVGTFMFNHGINNWLPEILRTGGMPPARAGYWAAIPTAIGIFGSLIVPRLAIPRRRIAILIGLLLCAAVAASTIARASGGALLAGLLLQGIARSALLPLLTLVLMECDALATRYMGAAGGLFFTAAEVGGVLGPLTVGWLADLSGGFTTPLTLLTLIAVSLATLAAASRSLLAPAEPLVAPAAIEVQTRTPAPEQ